MSKKRFLYVDDQKYMHQLVSFGAAEIECDMVAVTSLEKARETLMSSSFDLIMTDLALGEADGLELVDMVRADPAMKGMPIVVLSMHNDSGHVDEARRHGVDDYIMKPFQMKRVKQAISRWTTLGQYDIGWSTLSEEQAHLTRLTVSTMGGVFSAAKAGDDVPHQLVRDNCLSILRAGQDDDIVNSLSALKDHDIKTYLHCVRFSAYLGMMAAKRGAGGDDMLDIIAAGLLHDIGVTKIPTDFLENERWTSDETKWFNRSHVQFAKGIAQAQAEPFSEISRHVMALHHERMDGTGPFRMTGDQLPEIARMACVVEAFLSLRDGTHMGGYRTTHPLDVMRTDEGLDQEMVGLLAGVHGS